MALDLFLCWLRSSRQLTTTPVGRWVIRTPLSVLFWCWPPGPPDRITSISRSSVRITMSTSSGSGSTATVAVEVWIRPWASVCGTRWTRWTPPSNWRWRYEPSPATLNETSRKPPSSVGSRSSVSNFQPICSANRRYISNRSRANSAASSPPGPGADLHDQRRMAGAGLAVVEQVAELLALLLLARAQAVELGLGVGTHLGIGLDGAELLGLGDLPAQLQVAAVGQRDLGQRTALLRQGRDPRRIGRDRRIEQRALDLQESLVIGLELLEHLEILGGKRAATVAMKRMSGVKSS